MRSKRRTYCVLPYAALYPPLRYLKTFQDKAEILAFVKECLLAWQESESAGNVKIGPMSGFYQLSGYQLYNQEVFYIDLIYEVLKSMHPFIDESTALERLHLALSIYGQIIHYCQCSGYDNDGDYNPRILGSVDDSVVIELP